MACKQETKEIDGKQVFVRQWPASKAIDMQIYMMNTLGDHCIGFIMEDEIDFKRLTYVLTNCDKLAFSQFVRECCLSARIDGKEITPSNFDVELSGDMFFIYKVFSFVLEVNFRDFFSQGLKSKEAQV